MKYLLIGVVFIFFSEVIDNSCRMCMEDQFEKRIFQLEQDRKLTFEIFNATMNPKEINVNSIAW